MGLLSGRIRRRSGWLLLAWAALAALAAVAAPISLHQTDNLADGGFSTPGSQSHRVDQELGGLPPAGPNATVVVNGAKGAPSTAVQARAAEVRRIAEALAGVRSAPQQASTAPNVLFVDLMFEGGFDERVDTAVLLREKLRVGAEQDGVQIHLVGPEAAWAALHDLQREHLAVETVGFTAATITGAALVMVTVFGVSFGSACRPSSKSGSAWRPPSRWTRRSSAWSPFRRPWNSRQVDLVAAPPDRAFPALLLSPWSLRETAPCPSRPRRGPEPPWPAPTRGDHR